VIPKSIVITGKRIRLVVYVAEIGSDPSRAIRLLETGRWPGDEQQGNGIG
jgi:hypothetical protein